MSNLRRRGSYHYTTFATRSLVRTTFDSSEGSARPRPFSPMKVAFLLPFIVLLVLAVRTMVVGSTAWETVLFSRYYFQLFVLILFGIPLFRALYREYDEYSFVGILLLGVIVGIVAGVVSPGHETSFCYTSKRMLYRDRVVVPDYFQCTTTLWGIPAALVFWWGTLVRRRRVNDARL